METRTCYCRGCRREVTVPLSGGGHPRGWYNLTVNVPPDMGNSHNGKPYVFIGVFCSVPCLVGHGPVMLEQEALMDGVYEKA